MPNSLVGKNAEPGAVAQGLRMRSGSVFRVTASSISWVTRGRWPQPMGCWRIRCRPLRQGCNEFLGGPISRVAKRNTSTPRGLPAWDPGLGWS